MTPPTTEKMDFVGTVEAAKLSELSPAHVRRMCQRGQIKAIKIAHDWIIMREDIPARKRKLKGSAK